MSFGAGFPRGDWAGCLARLPEKSRLYYKANGMGPLLRRHQCAKVECVTNTETKGVTETVQLIPPQYAKPFVKRNKNDAAGVEAICEAVTQPNMPAVPIKDAHQQAVLCVHRARQGFVKARTAQANQIRGPLAEYGIAIPQGIGHISNKRGDSYLRTLLIHGARAVVRFADGKPSTDAWLQRWLARWNKNVAAVALANKNTRTLWASLAHDRECMPDYKLAA